MRLGVEREDVEAVGADDPDREQEEDDEPAERQAEQPRRRQVGQTTPEPARQEALTSSQSCAYTRRLGT
jgi:hypothetical protein